MSQTPDNWAQFLNRLAHDLREPLRAVHAFSELLNETAKDRLDPESGRFLEEILAGSSRISTIVDALSRYALALEEEKDTGAEASLQLAFDAAVAALDGDIQASGAIVTGDPLPRVGVRLERLIQLLGNLLGNSLRFRRDGVAPVIHVSAQLLSHDQWTIRVQDNGIGVAAEDRETIFKPFVRVYGRKYPGVGLGLTICRAIVDNHGGTIRIEPAKDAGSVVIFTLPAI
jgi:signal transduction histidine kinase